MIPFGDDVLADFVGRTLAGDGAPLVQELFDDSTVRQNNRRGRTEFERVHASIFFGPFCESLKRSESRIWCGTRGRGTQDVATSDNLL